MIVVEIYNLKSYNEKYTRIIKMKILKIFILALCISSITSFADEKNILQKPIVRGSNTFTVLDMYKTKVHTYKIKGTFQDIEGIVYVFLCSSNSEKDKIPSLTPLEDFKIDGYSYKELTKEKVGTIIESPSATFDVEDFVNKYRPDLKQYLFNTPEKSIILITTVYGIKLPKSGIINTIVKISWIPTTETELQSYEFEANLTNLHNLTLKN